MHAALVGQLTALKSGGEDGDKVEALDAACAPVPANKQAEQIMTTARNVATSVDLPSRRRCRDRRPDLGTGEGSGCWGKDAPIL
jgi:hypothetical protein